MKKRNPIARALRTPRFKLRVVLPKKVKRPKHKKLFKKELEE